MINWQTKKLEKLVDFIGGLWVGKNEPFIKVNVLRNTNFRNTGLLNFDNVARIDVEERQLSSRTLERGDIILEKSGGGPDQPVGRVAYFDTDGTYSYSNFTCCIRILNKLEIDSKYLWYFLYSQYSFGATEKMQKQTTGIRNLIMPEYKNLEIPLPPLKTQKEIVAKLDEKFAKLREAKQLRQEALADTEKILSQTLREIFEEGKQKGWTEKKIKDICEHPQYGFTASSSQNPIGPKMLRITDIQDEKVNWDTVPYCECEEPEKYELSNNDIVFARTGATVGKSYLVRNLKEPAVFASYLIRLTPKDGLTPEFLYYFFQSPNYWNQIGEQAAGGAQPNVNGTKLANLKLFLPPLSEQQKIVTKLYKLSEKIRTLRELQISQLADLKRLEKSYLREAFNGELV